MKSLFDTKSLTRPLTFIISISIHMLIFWIPMSMVIKPEIHEMELFVFIDDIRVPLESGKKQMAIKKLQPEPVKEITTPIEAPPLKIEKPEMSEPEPVKEVTTPIEAPPLKIEKAEISQPVREVKAESVKAVKVKPIQLEPDTQPTTESKEALFVPPESSITERNTYVPAESGANGMASAAEKHLPVSQNVSGSYARSPIETTFGESVAPAFLHREMPVYPMMARRFSREGKVVLKLTIDENGNLKDVEVIDKAGYGFTEAAVEAVKKSTFLPAKKDGKPIASRALLPIRFQLERN
jgi:protein TonB